MFKLMLIQGENILSKTASNRETVPWKTVHLADDYRSNPADDWNDELHVLRG